MFYSIVKVLFFSFMLFLKIHGAQQSVNKTIDLTLLNESIDGRKVSFVQMQGNKYIAATFGKGTKTYSYFCCPEYCEMHKVSWKKKSGDVIHIVNTYEIDLKYYGLLKTLFEKHNN